MTLSLHLITRIVVAYGLFPTGPVLMVGNGGVEEGVQMAQRRAKRKFLTKSKIVLCDHLERDPPLSIAEGSLTWLDLVHEERTTNRLASLRILVHSVVDILN